jgi:TonB family protein
METLVFLAIKNYKSTTSIVLMSIMVFNFSFKPSLVEKGQYIDSKILAQSVEMDTIKRGSIAPPVKSLTRKREEILKDNADKIPMEDKPSGKDSNGEDFYDIVAIPSMPSGGIDGWSQYLSSNLRYPEEAKEKGISGIVIATFLVKKDGTLYDIEILRGIGGGCDEELLRVIRNSPIWTAGKLKNGEPVNTKIRMPVRFK